MRRARAGASTWQFKRAAPAPPPPRAAHYFLERGKGVGPTYPKRQTPPPHPATMSVVGIDFGNQNAVIAAAGRGGVDVILNGNSNRLNP